MTKIKLNISIFGECINIQEINEITGLLPTSFWSKGDEILGINKLIYRKESCWELDYGFFNHLFLDEISNQVVNDFSKSLEDLSKYIHKNQLESKFFIVAEIVNNETPALIFNKSFLNMVLKINGEIDVDLYII